MEYTQQPAFPPQVAQDNLGRLIAPIPGMSKLEFGALMLLPTFIQLARKTDGLRINGKPATPYQAAIEAAQTLFKTVNKSSNENNNSNLELVG
jgi:hypothetical protein